MSWKLELYGHHPDGHDNTDGYAEVKAAVKNLVTELRGKGHKINPDTASINGQGISDVVGQQE